MRQATATEVRLPIRVRRTIDGAGEMTATMLVHCDSRRRSITLDDCTNCDQCGAVRVDPLEEDSYVTCRKGLVFGADDTVEERAVADGDRTRVWSVMPRRVVCVLQDAKTDLLRDILLERGVTGAPVVDPLGTVIGFVSRADLLRGNWPSPATVVGEIMTPLAVTVSESASLAEASALMALEGIHVLPVVNNAAAGNVVGVISALDVLRWFARKCGYLRQDMHTGN
jgi:CBS domain-containing protein